MLKDLINRYGKDKINSLTKYPSILTLHKFAERGRFSDELTTNISGQQLFASEKIDGTNVRIVCLGEEFLVGSRNSILHYSEDLYWDEAMGIVNQFYSQNLPTITANSLTIIYGELFGGKVTAKSKNYGSDSHGFRIFDIAEIGDMSILEKSITEISHWRESTIEPENDSSLRYGQDFYNLERLKATGFELVPQVEFDFKDTSHQEMLNALERHIPKTNVALTDSAQMGTEGVVLRNFDRSRIVKIRFEDYRRTLKAR